MASSKRRQSAQKRKREPDQGEASLTVKLSPSRSVVTRVRDRVDVVCSSCGEPRACRRQFWPQAKLEFAASAINQNARLSRTIKLLLLMRLAGRREIKTLPPRLRIWLGKLRERPEDGQPPTDAGYVTGANFLSPRSVDNAGDTPLTAQPEPLLLRLRTVLAIYYPALRRTRNLL